MKAELLGAFFAGWELLSAPIQNGLESVAVVITCLLARVLILKIVRRRIHDSRTLYSWRKGSQYAFTIIAITMIASIWFRGVNDVATFLGLLSAGVAVALKDPLSNIVGWAFILWQRPFSVGDRVEIQNVIGDVVDQRFFTFTMLEVGHWNHGEQSTGRVLHVPNSHVFASHLYNYTEPFEFIWDEIAVVLTFESDWRRAKKELATIANAHAEDIIPLAEKQLAITSKRTLITYANLSPIVYTSVVDAGVKLTVRYLTPTRRRRGAHNNMWEDILDLLAANDSMELAYYTQRVIADGLADFTKARPTSSSPGDPGTKNERDPLAGYESE